MRDGPVLVEILDIRQIFFFTFAITNPEYFRVLHPERGLDLLHLRGHIGDFFDLSASAKPAIVNSRKGLQLGFHIVENSKQFHD